jgi:hypothetical protein
MLNSEIIDVCSQIHTKHINTLCGQNVGDVNVIPSGTYSDHWDLKIICFLSNSLSIIGTKMLYGKLRYFLCFMHLKGLRF